MKDKKFRQAEGFFVVEGFRELKRALDTGKKIKEVYLCQEIILNKASERISNALPNTISVVYLSADVFKKLSYRESPDGILGIVECWGLSIEKMEVSSNPFFIVAEGLEKPGNLGALVRSAEGAGADGLILCASVVDIFNPNCVRASQGAIFNLPIALSDNSTVFEFLQKNKIQMVATSPDAPSLYWDISYLGPTAILVGNEHEGLSSFWMENASQKAKIPMQGISDSLNVHTAACLGMYELLRQRMG